MDNKYFIDRQLIRPHWMECKSCLNIEREHQPASIDLERGLVTFRCCECGNYIVMTLDEIKTTNKQVPA